MPNCVSCTLPSASSPTGGQRLRSPPPPPPVRCALLLFGGGRVGAVKTDARRVLLPGAASSVQSGRPGVKRSNTHENGCLVHVFGKVNGLPAPYFEDAESIGCTGLPRFSGRKHGNMTKIMSGPVPPESKNRNAYWRSMRLGTSPTPEEPPLPQPSPTDTSPEEEPLQPRPSSQPSVLDLALFSAGDFLVVSLV